MCIWHLCLKLYIVILIAGMYVATKFNVGTVLFHIEDANRHCWTKDTISLLNCRYIVEDLLPKDVVKPRDGAYIRNFVDYMHHTLDFIHNNTIGTTQEVMILAVADAVGGYLRSVLLPLTKQQYYNGNLRYNETRKLYNLYEDIKNLLKTSGHGWAKPSVELIKHENLPSLKVSVPKENACSDFILKEESSKDESISIPLPYLDDNSTPHSIALPIKPMSLHSLYAPSSAYLLQKYYIGSVKCLISFSGCQRDVIKFNEKFDSWLTHYVVPHLNDECWYPAFGGINRVVQTVQRVLSISSNLHKTVLRSASPYNESETMDLLDTVLGAPATEQEHEFTASDYLRILRSSPSTSAQAPYAWQEREQQVTGRPWGLGANLMATEYPILGSTQNPPSSTQYPDNRNHTHGNPPSAVPYPPGSYIPILSGNQQTGAGQTPSDKRMQAMPNDPQQTSPSPVIPGEEMPPGGGRVEPVYNANAEPANDQNKPNLCGSENCDDYDSNDEPDLKFTASIFTALIDAAAPLLLSALLLSPDLAMLNLAITFIVWTLIAFIFVLINHDYDQIFVKDDHMRGKLYIDYVGERKRRRKEDRRYRIHLKSCPHRKRKRVYSDVMEGGPAFTRYFHTYYSFINRFSGKIDKSKHYKPEGKDLHLGTELLHRKPSGRVISVTRSASVVPEYSIEMGEDTISHPAGSCSLSSQDNSHDSDAPEPRIEAAVIDDDEFEDEYSFSENETKFGEPKYTS